MAGKKGTELGKALADRVEPKKPNRQSRRRPSYKETKWREVGRVADEVVVLRMGMRQNVPGGKDLC